MTIRITTGTSVQAISILVLWVNLRRRRVAAAVEAEDHDREQRDHEEHDQRHDRVHPVRQPVHVVGDRGHRGLVVDAARDRRADHRQVPRLAGRLRRGPGGGSERRERGRGRSRFIFIASVPFLLAPRAVRRPPGWRVVAGARSTILTTEGQDAALPQCGSARDRTAIRSPTMPEAPRFRPFETALDPEAALGILRAATEGADDGELFLERRRGGVAGLRRRPAAQRHLRRRRRLRPARRQRRDRRLRPLDRDLRGGAEARRRDRAPRGRRRRRHARRRRRSRPTSASIPTATRSTTPSSR